jgi:hypothetical protein
LLLPAHHLPDRRVRQNHRVRHVLLVVAPLVGHLHWVAALDVAQVLPDPEVAVLPSEGLVFLQLVVAEVVEALHWPHWERHQKTPQS